MLKLGIEPKTFALLARRSNQLSYSSTDCVSKHVVINQQTDQSTLFRGEKSLRQLLVLDDFSEPQRTQQTIDLVLRNNVSEVREDLAKIGSQHGPVLVLVEHLEHLDHTLVLV